MGLPVTVRLDDETRKRVTRLARRKRIPFSKAMRIALGEWADREESGRTPYERVAHLIGVVRGGDPSRSADLGRKYAKALRARRGHR